MVIFHSDPKRAHLAGSARPVEVTAVVLSLPERVHVHDGKRPVAFRGDRDATGLATVVDEVMAGEELGVDLSPAFRVEPAIPHSHSSGS